MDCSSPRSSVQAISQQEYWSGLPFPSPDDLPEPWIEPPSLDCRWILYHWTTREALCIHEHWILREQECYTEHVALVSPHVHGRERGICSVLETDWCSLSLQSPPHLWLPPSSSRWGSESCSKECSFLQISDGKPTICWRISHLVFTSAYHSPILQLYPNSEKWQTFPLSHSGWSFKSIGNSTGSC